MPPGAVPFPVLFTKSPPPPWAQGTDLWANYQANVGSGLLFPPGVDTHGQTIASLNATSTYLSFGANAPVITNLGLQTVPTRTNLLLRSQAYDDAAWSKVGSTISPDTAVAPDGTTTADTLTDTNASAQHQVNQAGVSVTSGTTYCFAALMKAGTYNLVQITTSTAGFASPGFANFNLATGAAGTTGGTFVSSGIVSIGNGWYLCYLVATATATTTASGVIAQISAITDPRIPTYLGTGTRTVLLWNSDFTAGVFAVPPITTTSATLTVNGNQQVVGSLGPQFTPGFEFNWQFQLLGQDSATKRAFVFSNGAANDVVRIDIASTGILTAVSASGGVFDGSCALSVPLVIGAVNNLVLSAGPNYLRLANNADVGTADTSVTYPSVSQMAFGGNGFDATDNSYVRSRKATVKFRAQDNTTWADAIARQALMAAG